ncbi:MAG: SEC-C domain-containing protein [Marinilabiliaceae bacterium]|nr:SEC-C domain-containing protein [Marinilabiliaceae bacterium]
MLTFKEQAEQIKSKYPNLFLIERKGFYILKGILNITSHEHEDLGCFSIEIIESKGFPYRFPILFEVGGDIPIHADWHKYPNNSCCITVLPDEILKCKNGISLHAFIEEHAKAYLANHLHRVKHGKYLNGEYSHGTRGFYQFYSQLLRDGDKSKWREWIELAFSSGKAISRNEPCICGSNKKYKHCHDKVFADVRKIGKKQIDNDFKRLFI